MNVVKERQSAGKIENKLKSVRSWKFELRIGSGAGAQSEIEEKSKRKDEVKEADDKNVKNCT